jgi:hypothetical protein
MLRQVSTLMYSCHSTTNLISFVVATATVSIKVKAYTQEGRGKYSTTLSYQQTKNKNQKGFSSRQSGLLLFRLRSSTVILLRQLTIAISHSIPDTTRRQIHTLFKSQSWILLESRYPSRERTAFCFIFLRREVILFLPFIPLCCFFPFRIYMGVFSFGISYRHLLVFM